MSSFSGLSTALSSLTAQRQALDVAGQNIANANTPGYTRQRAELQSVEGVSRASMYSRGLGTGQGVQTVDIARLGDIFLDARVRTATSSSSYLSERAAIFTGLESTIAEPGETGISQRFQDLWKAWQDVGNRVGEGAPGRVLIEQSNALVDQIASGYTATATQWSQVRTQASALVTEVNSKAAAVAELNQTIRAVSVAGGAVNELMDQRDTLVTSLAGLVGATSRQASDGSVEVFLGGNSLVSGTRAQELVLTGGTTLEGAATSPVTLEWARTPGHPVSLDGGRVGGMLSALGPANATGTGGILAEAAASYNALATAVASQVNAIHSTGQTTDGRTGIDFFRFEPGVPAALGLRVAVTDAADIAAAAVGAGPLDNTIANKISAIGSGTGSPDSLWTAFVVDTGVKSKAAQQSAGVAKVAQQTAESLQLSQASVDVDEETVNMLMFQRAYQGASRVITAIDEMLDTLINRTGVVGR